MDVVITGGHGGIGGFVLEELRSRGHSVTVFDLDDNVDYRARFDYDYVEGDLTDADQVADVLAGQDAVINLAALKRSACQANPKLAQEVNVGGTVNVLQGAVETGVRVLDVSTKAVFGHISGRFGYPHYEPLAEDATRTPVGNIYALTKAAGESYRQVYEDRHGIDAASFRFGSSFGPGKVALEGKGMLIPDAIEGAMRGQSVTLPGGDELNDWAYFGDIATGLADAVDADSLSYSTYHIATGEGKSMHDFADVLREACPDAEIDVEDGTNPQNKDHPQYAVLDISRAKDDLDYEPQYGLAGGIRDYMDRLDLA
jgi:nucleoside-diphosphate-sugar epimerase